MSEKTLNFLEPYKPCGRCDSHGFIVNGATATKCSCWTVYKNRLSLINKMLGANLIVEESSKEEVDRLLSYTLDDYKGEDTPKNLPKIKKFLSKFDEKFNSINLFFTGTNGTQKTTVVKYMVLELLRTNHSAYYTLTKDFIDLVMLSERDEEKAKKLDEILKVDFLVLEEFSPDKLALYSSGYKQSIVTSPIKKRFENIRKSTVVISNFSITELRESALGNTIVDLIDRETRNGCQFTFTDRYGDYAKIDLSSIWDD